MNIYSVLGFSFIGAERMIVICELKGFFFHFFWYWKFGEAKFSKKIENLVKFIIENKISPKFSLFFWVKWNNKISPKKSLIVRLNKEH